ncbi:hypothetical protein ASPCAL15050 [Aspergillus calidoustus]|uniref:Uncharacterized protein n=1 Tax=Aspergillus calidoustus TaxID=454130 RepID=A0A0U5HCI4_ASPCI|nr:hypothetical protein ASPCAL15050 [Aspergillus calidoustus]
MEPLDPRYGNSALFAPELQKLQLTASTEVYPAFPNDIFATYQSGHNAVFTLPCTESGEPTNAESNVTVHLHDCSFIGGAWAENGFITVIFIFRARRIWVPVPEGNLDEELELPCGISYTSDKGLLMTDVYLKTLGGGHEMISVCLDDCEIKGVEDKVDGDDSIAILLDFGGRLWVFVDHEYVMRRGYKYLSKP